MKREDSRQTGVKREHTGVKREQTGVIRGQNRTYPNRRKRTEERQTKEGTDQIEHRAWDISERLNMDSG